MRIHAGEKILAATFVFPATLLIGAFVFWPAVGMARVSLHDQTLTDAGIHPTGDPLEDATAAAMVMKRTSFSLTEVCQWPAARKPITTAR